MRHELIAGTVIAMSLGALCAEAQGTPYPSGAYPQQSYPAYTGAPVPSYSGYPAHGSTPPVGAYAPGQGPYPPAAPDQAESSDGTGLIIGGTITLGSFYLFSALSMAGLGYACDASPPESLQDQLGETASICGDGDPALGYIPLVGPFVAMGELMDTPLSVWPIQVGLVALGVGQIAGAGLLIGGIAQGTGDDVSIQPVVGPGMAAVAVGRRF